MATILVADDDPISQRMLGVILGRLGHTVVSAANGQEALERLTSDAPDMLILDLAMPVMDGLTTLRRIRADRRFDRLPVVMLTASGLEHDERAARAAGATEFLTKPFRSQELVEQVDSFLGGASSTTKEGVVET
jgi:CheY-like chemotaxis protein